MYFEHCTWLLVPSWMLLTPQHTGKMAEWSKVLVKGTSHFGGVVLSPTPDILSTLLYKLLYPLYWTPANDIFYHHPCYWPQNIQAGWPSGIRRCSRAPVTLVAWVRDQHLSFFVIPVQNYVSCFFFTYTSSTERYSLFLPTALPI